MQKSTASHSKQIIAFATLAIAALTALAIALPQQTLAAEPQSDLTLTTQASKGIVNATIFSSNGGTDPILTKTVKKYDITGDGKADSIRFEITGVNYSFASTLKVYVNKKLCYTSLGYNDYGFIANAVTAKYLRMKSGAPFLFVECNTNNNDGTHDILQYRKGKLVPMVSNSQLPTGYGNHNQIRSAKVSGNTIKVKFMQMTYAAGAIYSTYTYVKKDGKLKRKSSQTSSLEYSTYVDGATKSGKPYGAARTSMKTYKSPGSSKAAFTVKLGQKIKLTKMCFKSGKLYFRATTKSGKSGWFESPSHGYGTYGGDTLVEGTYMAG